ncbi:cytochrome c556 [Xanthomonas arboricola]|jgi:cytochrome c556|uniref:cytochrome c n=1 Tax=Xanthomonas euroxanthea TaxID=2259622 RepID=UPI00141AE6D2|nr:cytochrome c [Xanthomonas euroxanthea]MBB3779364.1 cytochrome c556 [Xanthomonas euroxanthea]NIK07069.1 cytochrome c556 [Xanthomonas euroxanthea]
MPAPPTKQSRASRYAFLLVLGILIGLVATVMVARVLQATRNPVPDSLMQVMAYQLRALQSDANASCDATRQRARLQSLRLLADELEPAFPDIGEDRRFGEHASALRTVLDQARRTPPADCAALAAVRTQINDACEACHRDFR